MTQIKTKKKSKFRAIYTDVLISLIGASIARCTMGWATVIRSTVDAEEKEVQRGCTSNKIGDKLY